MNLENFGKNYKPYFPKLFRSTHHLLLVDEVGGLHDQVHQLVCVVTPGVEVFQGVLLWHIDVAFRTLSATLEVALSHLLLCEVDNSLKPVGLRRNCSRHNLDSKY